MNEIILSILKQARTNKKYTQKFVAEKIGVKGNTIGNYENGVTEPDIDTFIKLCHLYELDCDEVLNRAYGSSNTKGELTTSEIDLIKKYRQLDADGKERITNMLDFEISQINRKDEQYGDKAM